MMTAKSKPKAVGRGVFRLMFRSPIGVWLIGCAAIPEQHRVRAAATFVGWSERRA
jgi:hypothetical protein